MSKNKTIASQVIEFVNSFLPKNVNSEGFYNFGENNYYPNYVRYLIDNSVTAKSASDKMTDYVAGKGVAELPELKQFIDDVARQIVEFNGVCIHVNRNLNGDITDFRTLPFHYARIGKKDSLKYNGKIGISSDWSDKENIEIFDVFNNDKKVIEAQFKKQGKNYKGQILFLNFAKNYLYPLSRIHPVINDVDSEIQSSIFKNRSLNSGFFGKQLIITPPFIDPLIDAQSDPTKWAEGNRKQQEFANNLKKMLGVKNAGNILHITMEFDNEDDVNKKILFKEFKSNIDDKTFSYTEKSVRENIALAFKNLPLPFITSPDSSLFSQSGELWKEMQKVYQKNTYKERMILSNILKELFEKSVKYKGATNIITPLIEVSNEQ